MFLGVFSRLASVEAELPRSHSSGDDAEINVCYYRPGEETLYVWQQEEKYYRAVVGVNCWERFFREPMCFVRTVMVVRYRVTTTTVGPEC